ncbi:OmpP1/FadL family transporter [Pedobacter sp. SYSU D00535]|uniref:OmpP1/FadL family transporter n=1 Tax=Pedobacter sp. SYSU D00535 TaxID=2810308 RepID=UPI001A95C734|nr:hypothetical protein [Pedobacter sp. SYSU D00535]
MKLKNIALLAGLILPAGASFAQYAEDALRFSQAEPGLTTRFRGLGGAQTALGGDLSSLGGNPAGLGLFTKSEASLTADFSNSNLNAQYLGTSSSFQKDRGGIDQAGLVIYNPTRRSGASDLTSGWLSFNFGIGYNKTNNFNVTTDYSGQNNRSSFADFLADEAERFNPSALGDAAYNNFLVAFDDTYGYYPITSPGNNQQNTTYRTGFQSEVNFAVGANYENKLYVGAAFAFTSLNYKMQREYTESGQTLLPQNIEDAGLVVEDASRPYLNSNYRLGYISDQLTNGSGVNGKLGLIYRPVSSLRLGVSFVTPTWYTVSDSFMESLDARYTTSSGSSNIPGEEEYYDQDYTIRTPYKLNGGVAVTIAPFGLISGDVEYVDYQSMHFSASGSPDATKDTNRDIRDLYKSAVNLRIGAEARLPASFLLRAGYSTNGNPYNNADFSSDTFSAGIGFRGKTTYFDLALTSNSRKYSTSPYRISEDYLFYPETGSGDQAAVKNNWTNIFATIGFRF